MPDILQCDRDRAADLLSGIYGPEIREGRKDTLSVVQAFAAHREAERAAVVAWLRHSDQDGYSCVCSAKFADAIEHGEHHKS
jgi:hypothetical protein